ncbi:MAG: TIGR04076 family protein [Rhodoplanes sp.]|uniref:TIGR04076 family protein n=1 Tax=Rhodoplanes sp. TaxID=1968906 RepID=UPI00185C54C9|nr:TIGR04076 family protein [Rhodoplanes sp.]NVO17771.1 TIGR04076 family protein [Rhodoplanes sp.]
MTPERGHRVQATVKCIKGTCNAGHKVGDVLNPSARNTAGMCGYLYHAAHPTILMLQFGGSVPWGDTVELQCPDTVNLLTLDLRRASAEIAQGATGQAELAAAEIAATPVVHFGRVLCKIDEG